MTNELAKLIYALNNQTLSPDEFSERASALSEEEQNILNKELNTAIAGRVLEFQESGIAQTDRGCAAVASAVDVLSQDGSNHALQMINVISPEPEAKDIFDKFDKELFELKPDLYATMGWDLPNEIKLPTKKKKR